MRRILPVLALSAFLGLTACDFLERKGGEKSEAEQAVTSVRDGIPSGTVRTLLDVVLLGLGIYASAKGNKTAKVHQDTEARDYNLDEARSMHKALVELGALPPKP